MIDQYNEIRVCDYKGEHYSVRDNGAVMRHARVGKRIRKYDNLWTLGNPNKHNGYLLLVDNPIHRIVATAFHGNCPGKNYVVDHIDTNRRNNRPENLRWVTRLENILNNEITRARIINICGSIEAFLKKPALLKGHEHIDSNFSWMRTVTPEEAHACLKRMQEWAKEPRKKTKKNTGNLGEWIYKEPQTLFTPSEKQQEEELLSYEIPSLTPNATQIYWATPSFFPCCPSKTKNNPLSEYYKNLKNGATLCYNNLYSSIVYDSVLINEEKYILVITRSINGAKDFALAKITYKGGVFAHENMGSFFSEDGVKKRFTILQGKEWTGPDSIDDYC